MRKYENVDVIATLGAILEFNTEHYKTDFQYDVKRFKEAAKRPDGENNRFLWLSRRCGTECLPERNVYLIGSDAHTIWQYYTERRDENPLAYAVEITGLDGRRVMGNLYELNYRKHAAEVKKTALHVINVRLKYADGAEIHMPYERWNKQASNLYNEHGQLLTIYREPEDEDELRSILKDARAEREKESRPAVFTVCTRNQKS
jgi:hypothetical protein